LRGSTTSPVYKSVLAERYAVDDARIREAPASLRPNLFVIGTAKGATHVLWRGLGAHPDVYMSAKKEPNYFSGKSKRPDAVLDPVQYLRLFEPGAGLRYRGEATVTYIAHPQIPVRMRAALDDVHAIASLRDPVERSYSAYWTAYRMGIETRTFAQAIEDELASDAVDTLAYPPPYVARGLYAEQLEPWLATFSTVYIVFFEEFIADVRAHMRDIYRWLDLDPAPADGLDTRPQYPFQLPRSRAVATLMSIPGVKPFAQTVLRGPLRERIETTFYDRRKPPIEPELRLRLREVYAPHDERLRELLGRSLPWDGRD
jgi:Sulfotransferase family